MRSSNRENNDKEISDVGLEKWNEGIVAGWWTDKFTVFGFDFYPFIEIFCFLSLNWIQGDLNFIFSVDENKPYW